jgi:hypothetical protein
MLTWSEAVVNTPEHQMTVPNRVIPTEMGRAFRYLEIVRSWSVETELTVVKKIYAIPKKLSQYSRSTMHGHVLSNKLMEKRSAPVHPAGFYAASKLNLRNAP